MHCQAIRPNGAPCRSGKPTALTALYPFGMLHPDGRVKLGVRFALCPRCRREFAAEVEANAVRAANDSATKGGVG